MTRWIIAITTALMLTGTGLPVMAGEPGTSENGSLTWYKYDKAVALAKKQNKFILIDFYTTWCGWCKVMDDKTYTDPTVQKLLKESFILVKVNAESKRFIKLQGQKITETQLASIYRVRSYPTTWFLQPNGKAIAPLNGYVDAERFEPVLRYIADGWYKKMGFEQYMKQAD